MDSVQFMTSINTQSKEQLYIDHFSSLMALYNMVCVCTPYAITHIADKLLKVRIDLLDSGEIDKLIDRLKLYNSNISMYGDMINCNYEQYNNSVIVSIYN